MASTSPVFTSVTITEPEYVSRANMAGVISRLLIFLTINSYGPYAPFINSVYSLSPIGDNTP